MQQEVGKRGFILEVVALLGLAFFVSYFSMSSAPSDDFASSPSGLAVTFDESKCRTDERCLAYNKKVTGKGEDKDKTMAEQLALLSCRINYLFAESNALSCRSAAKLTCVLASVFPYTCDPEERKSNTNKPCGGIPECEWNGFDKWICTVSGYYSGPRVVCLKTFGLQ